MPLRRRLALYGTGVAAAGMFLFILLLSNLSGNGARENQDRNLDTIATAAAASLARGETSAAASRPFVVTDLRTSTEPFVLVLSNDGQIRYASGLLDGAPPRVPAAVVVEANDQGRSVATIAAAPSAAGTFEPPGFRVVARTWKSATDGGIVVAGQTSAFPDSQVAGLRVLLVLSALVTLVVVAIVSWLVAGRAVRPLVTLAQTTSEIGTTGDLSRRVALSKSRDEVGRLTTSFNAMLERLQHAQAELEGALSAQQRFVADASHELRNPLATVRTSVEFLREHPDADARDRSEALSDAIAEVERMSRLVDGLLVLARADAGVDVERRPVDLRAVATEEARRARGAVRIDTSGAALVSGDPDALGRVVRILLDNAYRHGAPPVDLAVRSSDGRVSLEVRDAGQGLPPGSEERVFDRFYRADSARSGEGTGLGLAIAKAIVESHGGVIRARNANGGGAAVTFELPAL